MDCPRKQTDKFIPHFLLFGQLSPLKFTFFGCGLLKFIIKLFYLFTSKTQGVPRNAEKKIYKRQMCYVQAMYDGVCSETLGINEPV